MTDSFVLDLTIMLFTKDVFKKTDKYNYTHTYGGYCDLNSH